MGKNHSGARFRPAGPTEYWQPARGTGLRGGLGALDVARGARVQSILAERMRPHQRPHVFHVRQLRFWLWPTVSSPATCVRSIATVDRRSIFVGSTSGSAAKADMAPRQPSCERECSVPPARVRNRECESFVAAGDRSGKTPRRGAVQSSLVASIDVRVASARWQVREAVTRGAAALAVAPTFRALLRGDQ
jgi:hypothetical protein